MKFNFSVLKLILPFISLQAVKLKNVVFLEKLPKFLVITSHTTRVCGTLGVNLGRVGE